MFWFKVRDPRNDQKRSGSEMEAEHCLLRAIEGLVPRRFWRLQRGFGQGACKHFWFYGAGLKLLAGRCTHIGQSSGVLYDTFELACLVSWLLDQTHDFKNMKDVGTR